MAKNLKRPVHLRELRNADFKGITSPAYDGPEKGNWVSRRRGLVLVFGGH
jgi:hypothetical protein